MPKLKGTITGGGYFAAFQAEGWSRIPEVQIAAVADRLPGKAEAFAARFHIPRAYSNVEEMLEREKPDFVDIATRPEAHLPLVKIAAARGIHVICQKPMAPSWQECIAMCEACEAAKVRLLIHENWRWQPWYREAKALLQRGRIGKPFQITFQWRTGDGRGPEPYRAQPYFRQMPRLLVYETLVHILDTFRFLAGEIQSLFCQNRRINPAITGEDQSVIQLKFAGGMLGLIDGNRMNGPMPAPVAMGSMLVEGDGGALRTSPDGRLWLTEHGHLELEHPFAIPDAGYKGDSVRATQAHLSECLRVGRPSESDGRDYLNTVALVEACYRSVEIGNVVQLSEFLPMYQGHRRTISGGGSGRSRPAGNEQ